MRAPRVEVVAAAAVTGLGVAGFLLLGPAGACVAFVLGVLLLRRWRKRRETRSRLAALAEVSEALGGLVAELRAGAHPATAAESVVSDLDHGDGPAALALRAVAAAARLGGDVDVVLAERAASAPPAMRAVLLRLARAWTLAQRHGLPLADVLDAVRADLESSARFGTQLAAKLAGPRASAAILSGLPVIGILLGEAMGASPVDVLATTGAGQVLLVAGGLLLIAGTTWCDRLTAQEVQA